MSDEKERDTHTYRQPRRIRMEEIRTRNRLSKFKSGPSRKASRAGRDCVFVGARFERESAGCVRAAVRNHVAAKNSQKFEILHHQQ